LADKGGEGMVSRREKDVPVASDLDWGVRGEVLQECRASMLFHMCFACRCLGPSPPPCAMQVPVGPAAALLLQSATEHLFPPPWAVHFPDEPSAPLGQSG